MILIWLSHKNTFMKCPKCSDDTVSITVVNAVRMHRIILKYTEEETCKKCGWISSDIDLSDNGTCNEQQEQDIE